MMSDPLESSHVSFQKQNCEGVVGTQSGQYRVTAELRSGCEDRGGLKSRDPIVGRIFLRGQFTIQGSHVTPTRASVRFQRVLVDL
ncbi:hypothetical protein ACFX2I_029136 [Malus domestica]